MKRWVRSYVEEAQSIALVPEKTGSSKETRNVTAFVCWLPNWFGTMNRSTLLAPRPNVLHGQLWRWNRRRILSSYPARGVLPPWVILFSPSQITCHINGLFVSVISIFGRREYYTRSMPTTIPFFPASWARRGSCGWCRHSYSLRATSNFRILIS